MAGVGLLGPVAATVAGGIAAIVVTLVWAGLFPELRRARTFELPKPAPEGADIVAEGYDVAIRVGELQASAMIARRVGTYRFRCVASSAYAAANGLPQTPDELRQHRCILNLNMSPRNRGPFYGPGGASVVAEVGGGLQIDNGEAQKAAALAGAGIVYLPVDLAAEDIAAGRLVPVLPGWQTLTLPIHLIHPSRRLVPRRVTALMDAIAAGLRE